MTWAPGTSYQNALDSSARDSVFAVEIDGWSTVYTTGPVSSATWTYKEYLSIFEVDPGGIDHEGGAIQLGELRFGLLDRNNEIRGMICTDYASATLDTLAGRQVTVYHGTLDLDQSDWETVGVFTIDSVGLASSDPLLYVFTAIDPFPQLNRPLFSSLGDGAKTTLAANADQTDTDIQVANFDDFPDHNDVDTSGIVIVDGDNYIFTTIKDKYNAGSGNRQDWLELSSGLSQDVNEDADVYLAYWMVGNPVDMLARVLLDDFATSGSIQTSYPLDASVGDWATGDGFGIATTLLDDTQIQTERDDFISELSGRVVITKRIENGSGWLQRYLSGLGVLFVRRNGKLGFKGAHLPVPDQSSDPPEITQATATELSWTREYARLVNKVIVRGNAIGEEVSKDLAEVDDTDSQTAVGKREKTIDSPWVWDDQNASVFTSTMAGRYLARFAFSPQKLEIPEAHLKHIVTEPGDLVLITHPNFPSTGRNNAALTADGAEVISSVPNFGTRTMQLEVHLYGGKRCAGIAPDSQAGVSYSSATDTEKNLSFWISQDAGDMPDGSPPFVWA